MKHIKLTILIFGLLLFGCKQTDNKTTLVTEEKATTSTDEKEQIQNLIRQVLNWADLKNSIDLLPVIADSKDSIYIGFNIDLHKQNLNKLRQTNLFASEFIENYNQIIMTLDKGLKNGNYDKWFVGDLPTFSFGSDVNPWTLSQDVPYDNPNPFDFVEIKLLNIDKGELFWKWGKPELITEPSWKDFEYKFRVVKENDNWKISYLQGFDFKESTR
ncbi:MAG TPA: hypothetical protein PLL09_15965 [Flavobacterium sp.]|uniref:hypothetical protein n=1 Tax=unclassified Flavobacterium TaxID=196869 RepID=UPI0025C6D9D2|nr:MULTISPECIES: hypothetical protein [unclassified Flavobacterium]HRE79313.1 hypothetical protein [Flavobacterium sp.]